MAWYWWLLSVLGVIAILALALFMALVVSTNRLKRERDSKTLLSVSSANQDKYIGLFNRKLTDIEVLFFGELGLNTEYINILVSGKFDAYNQLIDSYIEVKYQELSTTLTKAEAIEIKSLLYKLGVEFYTVMFLGKGKLKEMQIELSNA
jgi:type II secretory pathway pseudopilin PulG